MRRTTIIAVVGLLGGNAMWACQLWRWRQYVLRNADTYVQVHTALQPTIPTSTSSAVASRISDSYSGCWREWWSPQTVLEGLRKPTRIGSPYLPNMKECWSPHQMSVGRQRASRLSHQLRAREIPSSNLGQWRASLELKVIRFSSVESDKWCDMP
jgi:hypothetical protein